MSEIAGLWQQEIVEPTTVQAAVFQVDEAKTLQQMIEQTRVGGRALWEASCQVLEAQLAAGRYFAADPMYGPGKSGTVPDFVLPATKTIWRWQRAAFVGDGMRRAYLTWCRDTFDQQDGPKPPRLNLPSAVGLIRFDRAAQMRDSARSTPLPDGTYSCIVIDPPWPMARIETDARPNQPAALDYPTMTLDQIEDLPVRELAHEEGCHLYLWVTHHFLPAGLELVESWGFRYQCLMTWVKTGRGGMVPFSWMYDTEHVIFARCGSLDLTRLGLKLSFTEATTVHSAKPDVFYERVLAASPEPRIEMFARRDRDGFKPWGDEAP